MVPNILMAKNIYFESIQNWIFAVASSYDVVYLDEIPIKLMLATQIACFDEIKTDQPKTHNICCEGEFISKMPSVWLWNAEKWFGSYSMKRVVHLLWYKCSFWTILFSKSQNICLHFAICLSYGKNETETKISSAQTSIYHDWFSCI